MSRVLVAWELGRNLGHLSRIRPIARRLKARGHVVLTAARDLGSAARALAPDGLAFVQAPVAPALPQATHASARLTGYADLLLHQGWGEASHLVGLTQAWINLIRMFAPDAIILDHAPTAALAARSLGIPTAWIGTGFEIPPLATPLPPFPEIPLDAAAQAEASALDLANRVLSAMRLPELSALSELFADSPRWLATYPELDHYGARANERYVGVFDELGYGRAVEWAGRGRRRVFAYLRSQMPGHRAILKGLASIDADVVCHTPDVPRDMITSLARPGMILIDDPVRIDLLCGGMDLCVSYAPAGTVATTLLHGIPQLCAPPHREASLTALRVETLGAGLVLRGQQTPSGVEMTIENILETGTCAARAKEFAGQHRGPNRTVAVEGIVAGVEAMCAAHLGRKRSLES